MVVEPSWLLPLLCVLELGWCFCFLFLFVFLTANSTRCFFPKGVQGQIPKGYEEETQILHVFVSIFLKLVTINQQWKPIEELQKVRKATK